MNGMTKLRTARYRYAFVVDICSPQWLSMFIVINECVRYAKGNWRITTNERSAHLSRFFSRISTTPLDPSDAFNDTLRVRWSLCFSWNSFRIFLDL